MSTTPYMNLTLPTVSVTPGPTYATENNTAFTTIDSHNHTSGQGIQIPTLGININANLSFATYYAIQLGNARFVNQGSPLATASDINCVYFTGGNLYANDSSGNQVQITAGGAVNTAAGNINGMGATTASVTYTVGNTTFTFWSNNNVPAALDVGAVVIRETGATSPNGITLQSPSALASAYSLTLPTTVAATNNALVMSSTAGVLSYRSLGSANTVLRVNSAGTATEYQKLTTSNIDAAAGILGTQLASALTVTTSLAIAAGSAITPQGTTYKTAAANESFVLSHITASSGGMRIIRGSFSSAGAIIAGEGFSVSNVSSGVWDVTFSTSFSIAPSASVGGLESSGPVGASIRSITSSVLRINTFNTNTATSVDYGASFIVVGPI